MSSVTILTDDNEIVIIPRHRPSLQLIGGAANCDSSAVQPATVDASSLSQSTIGSATKLTHNKLFADGSVVTNGTTDFDRTDHVAVIDHATGLMWAVESIGDEDGDPNKEQA